MGLPASALPPAEPTSATPPRPRPHADVVARRMDRAGVLVDLRTNRIYEVNETGIRIWELMSDGASDEAIRECLTREFIIDADEASRQFAHFLEQVRDAGLLES